MESGGLIKGLNKVLNKAPKEGIERHQPSMCRVYLHDVHDVLHNLLLRGDRGNDCSHESLINRH